jgi:hypothetical protein
MKLMMTKSLAGPMHMPVQQSQPTKDERSAIMLKEEHQKAEELEKALANEKTST